MSTLAEVQHIRLQHQNEIAYPVGRNMEQTIAIVKEMAEKLEDITNYDDTIKFFVRGSSGAILSGLICGFLPKYTNIQIQHIKKEGESSHHDGFFDNCEADVNIIIDDFMSSGSTLCTIYDKMRERELRRVDILMVSGDVKLWKLNFKPATIISAIVFETEEDYNGI